MGRCFSCQRCRSKYQQDPRLPESKETEMEAPAEADSESSPAAPDSPPDASEAWSRSLGSSGAPAELATPVPEESVPEAALTLEALGKQLEDLKELQCQYLQGQLRVRRLCQQFPRSVRSLSLQVCRARRRLIRIEVRLKRQEGEEGLPALPASALTREPLLPRASDSQGLLSLGPSLSSASLPLHCSPRPPPAPPPPLWPDLGDLKEALATLLALQAHHLQDRKRDLRGCQECLKSIRALRVQLRSVRKRLSVLEVQLGIQVPPRELDVDEQEEEKEEPAHPPGGTPDTLAEEQEEIRT